MSVYNYVDLCQWLQRITHTLQTFVKLFIILNGYGFIVLVKRKEFLRDVLAPTYTVLYRISTDENIAIKDICKCKSKNI